MVDTCHHCGSHVSDRFARVFGDDDHVAHACTNCTDWGAISNGAAMAPAADGSKTASARADFDLDDEEPDEVEPSEERDRQRSPARLAPDDTPGSELSHVQDTSSSSGVPIEEIDTDAEPAHRDRPSETDEKFAQLLG